MKKLMAVIVVLSLLFSVSFGESTDDTVPVFSGLSDPRILQYTEDRIYAELANELDSEDYIIENIKAVYYSQEYLDELAFNSKANIFFGYTLLEIGDEFNDSGYVFTLGDDGSTVVRPFIQYDDTYDRIIRNVAIGTGVILICVTVSVVTAGVGLTTTSIIFTAAAKTGTTAAISSMAFGGVAAGIIKGYETGDLNEALKAAALQGSESFKWGAISGSVRGGLQKLSAVRRAAGAVKDATIYQKGTIDIPDDLPEWRKAELRALNENGGYEQLSFFDGKRVDIGTAGATRPDVVRLIDGHIEAIEVKYYDLESRSCLNTLYNELNREITARLTHLPKGSTQRIILDVTGREFSLDLVRDVAKHIVDMFKNVYPNIPVDIVGLLI